MHRKKSSCPYCGMEMLTKNMYQHCRAKHEGEPLPEKRWKHARKPCEGCGKELNETYLRAHKKSCGGGDPRRPPPPVRRVNRVPVAAVDALPSPVDLQHNVSVEVVLRSEQINRVIWSRETILSTSGNPVVTATVAAPQKPRADRARCASVTQTAIETAVNRLTHLECRAFAGLKPHWATTYSDFLKLVRSSQPPRLVSADEYLAASPSQREAWAREQTLLLCTATEARQVLQSTSPLHIPIKIPAGTSLPSEIEQLTLETFEANLRDFNKDVHVHDLGRIDGRNEGETVAGAHARTSGRAAATAASDAPAIAPEAPAKRGGDTAKQTETEEFAHPNTMPGSEAVRLLGRPDHAVNLLDMSDDTGRGDFRILCGVMPLQILRQLPDIGAAESGKKRKRLANDLSGCLEFNLLGSQGSISSPHMDQSALITVVRIDDTSPSRPGDSEGKLWMLANCLSEEEILAWDPTDPWPPGAQWFHLHLDKGDMLIQPAGRVHAVYGLSKTLISGRMYWDARDVIAHAKLALIERQGRYAHITNEDPARELNGKLRAILKMWGDGNVRAFDFGGEEDMEKFKELVWANRSHASKV